MNSYKKLLLTSGLLAAATTFAPEADATIVQFETNLGNFEVNLYDEGTPKTVENFLNYVNAGSYENIVIHRAVPDFVVQSGGFVYEGSWPVRAVEANDAVENEPVYSNVRGTIAMAKLGNLPNSATTEWFFNLSDNSTTGAALDLQNSGFTVFGEVVGDGMAIVDQISALPRFDFSSEVSALSTVPLQNFTANGGNRPDDTNFIIIQRITIIDAATDTAAGLNPPENTSISTEEPTSTSSGSGSFGLVLLGLLGMLGFRRRA